MQSQPETDRSSVRTNLITTDRPDSSQLVDLHVYIIPKNVWKDRQNLAENEAMDQAISAGFVRVPQNLNIHDLRQHILHICGQEEEFPKEFIYLRSVGRCLTKVKPQQETDLRVKNYRPPMTFAPEIYLLEGHHDDDPLTTPNSKSFLFRESPINRVLITPTQSTTSRRQSWVRPSPAPVNVHSDERQNSTFLNGPAITSISNFSTASSTLSARDLAKLREEQERLRLRQIELARQRREIEQEQQKREKDLLTKENAFNEQRTQENDRIAKDLQEKQKAAAIRIQATYRGYHYRRTAKQQQQQQISNFVKYRGLWSPESEEGRRRSSIKQRNVYSTPLDKYRKWRYEHQWSASSSVKSEYIYARKSDADQSFGFSSFRLAANEIERLQKEARELARRKAEEEHAEKIEAHDVVELSDRVDELKTKRVELEATRETIVRRMQQLHAQITVRRKEERDLWKQKYLAERKKTTALGERTEIAARSRVDVNAQVEQAKIHLDNSTKLRQQAENECQLLRQELHQIRLGMNSLEKQLLPKQSPAQHQQQQQQQTIPISLDITLQY